MIRRYADVVPAQFRPWEAAWGPPRPFLFDGQLLGDPRCCVNCGEMVLIPSGPARDPILEKIVVFSQGIQCHRCTIFLEECSNFHKVEKLLRSRRLN